MRYRFEFLGQPFFPFVSLLCHQAYHQIPIFYGTHKCGIHIMGELLDCKISQRDLVSDKLVVLMRLLMIGWFIDLHYSYFGSQTCADIMCIEQFAVYLQDD